MGFLDRLFGNKKKEEELAQAKLAEEKRLKEEAQAKLEAEASQKTVQEKLVQEAETKRLAEEAAQAKLEAEAVQKAEQEKLVQEAEAKRLAEEAATKQAVEAAQAKLEAEAVQKAEQEKLAQEAETKRLAEEALAKQAVEAAQAKLEAEAVQKAEQEKLAQEAEKKRLAEEAAAKQEAEAAQAKLEAEAAQKAEQEKLAQEIETKRLAEEAAATQAEEAAQAKLEAEASQKVEQEKLAQETETQRIAEEAATKQAEEEAQAKLEAEAAQKAEQEKLAQEAETKRLAEEDASKQAEQERLAKESQQKAKQSGGLFSKFFSKDKLDKGLEKSKESLFTKLTRAVAGKSKVDDEVLDDLEEVLITSDVGVNTTLKIIERIEARISKEKYVGADELKQVLRDEIASLLEESSGIETEITIPDTSSEPYVIMVVGVNGVGKTTTIGKLAHQFKQSGKSVLLGAADTFRAAAVDQLIIWSERVGVPIVQQGMNADPASVAFDTLQSAKAQGADVVIIDTAGRLHNKVGLMNELTKIKTVMSKIIPNAPHEILLVLDGSTGQNAFEQAKQFSIATDINALAVTKLDGTAKGGVVIGISDQFQIPVKYIGVGEGMEDLQVFNRKEFVDSFFK